MRWHCIPLGGWLVLSSVAVLGCSRETIGPGGERPDLARGIAPDLGTVERDFAFAADLSDLPDLALPDLAPPPAQNGYAVTYQVNPAHDGVQPKSTLTPPLNQKWSVDLGGALSYPLIARGRVFVTTRHQNNYGTDLLALDEKTGKTVWGPIDLGGTYFWSAAAWDGDRVFAVNYDGQLSAFDDATGQSKWSVKLPDQYAFSSAPSALNGIVYVGGAGSGGTVYAVDESNGKVLWTASVENGDDSSPAVDSDGVYVGYAENQVYDFAPLTGQLIWHYQGPGEGGGGKTSALHNGSLFTRDFSGNLILDAKTGQSTGSYMAFPIPAFDGAVGFFLENAKLTAAKPGGAAIWIATGDGTLSSAPLVVNGFVYAGGSSGQLYAFDEQTGKAVWNQNLGSPLPGPDEQNVSQPLTGLAAGDNMLVVPAGSTLIAF